MLQKYDAVKVSEIEEGATVHVALLDGDGNVIIHEELSAAAAPLRHTMLCLQAELDARDGQDRQVHRGPEWPPAGYREAKVGEAMQVTPIAAAET